MKRNRRAGLVASLAAVCLLTAGCLQSSDDSGDSGDSGGDSGGTAGAGGSDPNDGEVEIFGAFGADEADAFNESIKDFEEESGIDVKYTGDSDFTTLIRSRVQGGQPPDIALFPQPGLLLELPTTATSCRSTSTSTPTSSTSR